MAEALYLFAAVFIAFFIKGITGFGNTLVMAPLFSFVVSNRFTTPVDLLISIPTNAYLVWKNRESINFRTVMPLSLMLLVGVIPGILLLKTGNDLVLKAFLGAVIVALGIEMLYRKPPGEADAAGGNRALLVVVGLLSGVLAGMYGISAFLVAYVSRTSAGRSQFRANLCSLFLVDNIFRLIWYSVAGIMTMEIIRFTVFMAPAVVLGMYVGTRVDTGLKEETVRKATIYLLVVSGVVLLIRSAWGLYII
ncbi:MAG TPA: sulfite exporter TauE/SafE family protein [Clostridia bacterium]|nr:sulfite exporter TauE/SafE family protein [Clostridia bacterium]